jgi:nitrite reductase (NAD(P)H)
MTKAGHELNNFICPHFKISRAELYHIIKIKKLKNFTHVCSVLVMARDADGGADHGGVW